MVDFLIYKALAEVRPQIEPRNELLGLDPFVDLRTLPSALFNYDGDYSGRRHLLGRGTGLHGLRAGTSGAAPVAAINPRAITATMHAAIQGPLEKSFRRRNIRAEEGRAQAHSLPTPFAFR